jgi:hypothetical protein
MSDQAASIRIRAWISTFLRGSRGFIVGGARRRPPAFHVDPSIRLGADASLSSENISPIIDRPGILLSL